MKSIYKRLVVPALCLALFASLTVCPAAAAGLKDGENVGDPDERDTTFETGLADDLKVMGLFTGVSDTDYDLDRTPTRVEAITMLIQLLGRKSEALAGSWKHPFTDVPAWADKYVGYAYENGLIRGVASDRFGSGETAAANIYLTFMLRALGYSDAENGDFTWDSPRGLAADSGILPSCVHCDSFLRADMVIISYAALQAKMKGGTGTLAEKLISEGVIDPIKYQVIIDKYVFRDWSEFTRDTQEAAIEAITQRDGFVVKRQLDSPPFFCKVILGELNGNPELYLAYSAISGTGKGTGNGIVVQLPLPMETETCAALPDTLSIYSVTKGRSDGLLYSVSFDSSLIVDEGTENEKTIHEKGTYKYHVDLNTAEVTLSIE